MDKFVLDSWPLLEWAYGREPAATRFDMLVRRLLSGSVELYMSRINLGEVAYSLKRELTATQAARTFAEMATFPMTVLSVRDEDVDAAADLKAAHRRLSYADAFAAALAIRMNAPLVTGDPEFRALEQAGILQLFWLDR